jgi:hypothetical protein
MATRKVQPWVVGKWVPNADGIPHFEPCRLQPETAITDLVKMVAWAKANIKEPGSYEFIRKTAGSLVIAIQEEFKYSYA